MSTQANAGFELFDHTADVGIRVFGPTMASLVQPAAAGLYAVIGELAAGVNAGPLMMMRLARTEAPSAALLLREVLSELLWVFESEGRIATSVEVHHFDAHTLRVTCSTALVDPARTVYYREAKAVTYHELAIRATEHGYEAVFIVDI